MPNNIRQAVPTQSWFRAAAYPGQRAVPLPLACLLAVGGVGTAAISTDAAAQGLEEVVVTARRRVERDLEVPIAMTVMDSELLRRQNIGNLNDLGVQVPGLRMSNTANSTNTPIISMRGQRPNDLSLSVGQAVPIYFNEVVITPPEGSNLALYDLENVQILKGPQGTLFGRNSTGGAMLITTRRPGSEFGGYLQAGIGNYNLLKLEGAVDLPVNDWLQLRLVGRKLERDGYQDNVADNALRQDHFYWDEDSEGLRLSVNVEPDNGFSNLLTLSYDANDMVGRYARLESYVPSAFVARNVLEPVYNQQDQIDNTVARLNRGSKHRVEGDLVPRDDIEVWFASNATEYELSDSLSVKSVLGYRDMELWQAQEADGSTLPLIGNLTSTTELVTPNPPLYRVKGEQYSAELQLIGESYDSSLEWIAGAYWYRMEGSKSGAISQLAGPVVDPTIFDPNFSQAAAFAALGGLDKYGVGQTDGFGDVLNEALGAFAEANYHFSDSLSATLGLRYSRDDREVTLRNFQGTGREVGTPVIFGGYACALTDENNQTLPDDNCERSEEETFESPTWRVSLNYTATDGALIYGGVSTGYRTGGFNMRGSVAESFKPFEEETVTSYEIGNKTDWNLVAGVPLRSNLALYFQDYQDIQKTQQIASALGFATTIVNAAEADIYGLEADISWAATDRLTLSLAYAYTHTDYSDWGEFSTIQMTAPYSTVAPGIVNIDGSDNDFTYIPENTLSASLNYILPMPADLGELSFFASVYWQDEMMTSQITSNLEQVAELQDWTAADLAVAQMDSNWKAEDYALLNLRLDWSGVLQSGLDLSLYVENATDEEYVIGGANIIDIVGVNVTSYGPPRVYGAQLRYNF